VFVVSTHNVPLVELVGLMGFMIQAGLFYLKHANAVEGQVPTSELHSILLLALQWLSGSLNNTAP
jgi:hypothetical protein